MGKKLNLVDQRFGKILITKEAGKLNNKTYYWVGVCDCGNEVIVRGADLRIGNTKSCGCLQKTRVIETNKKRLGINSPVYKHGQANTAAYKTNKVQKRNAIKRNQTPELTKLEQSRLNFIYEVAGTMVKYEVDHIQPLSKGGLHHPDNLQILEVSLNRSKNAKYPLTKEEQVKYKGYKI